MSPPDHRQAPETTPRPTVVPLPDGSGLPALWLDAPAPRACLVLTHGAGAGMTHRAMVSLATGLARRRISTLRFDFPFMARGSRRPDAPAIARAAVRAAVSEAAGRARDLPLFAGGRSFGGRMTSQAQAETPMPGVRGLVLFAFPLHPFGKPGIERAAHLADIGVPTLFASGTRDALAEPALLDGVLASLPRAERIRVVEADHSFHVPAATGRRDADVLAEMLDGVAGWMGRIADQGLG